MLFFLQFYIMKKENPNKISPTFWLLSLATNFFIWLWHYNLISRPAKKKRRRKLSIRSRLHIYISIPQINRSTLEIDGGMPQIPCNSSLWQIHSIFWRHLKLPRYDTRRQNGIFFGRWTRRDWSDTICQTQPHTRWTFSYLEENIKSRWDFSARSEKYAPTFFLRARRWRWEIAETMRLKMFSFSHRCFNFFFAKPDGKLKTALLHTP